MLVWEQVLSDGGGYMNIYRTQRAKVPGGWLVCVYFDEGASVTFYPDPQHQWKP